MIANRIFKSADFLQPSSGEPIRSVISETADAAVIAWHVAAGQTISSHVHPEGQDTWTILSGRGDYRLDADGSSVALVAGDVVIAERGAVHGVFNSGDEPLIFVAVVSPASSGFELL